MVIINTIASFVSSYKLCLELLIYRYIVSRGFCLHEEISVEVMDVILIISWILIALWLDWQKYSRIVPIKFNVAICSSIEHDVYFLSPFGFCCPLYICIIEN